MFYGNLIRKEKYLQDKYNKWLNLPLKGKQSKNGY